MTALTVRQRNRADPARHQFSVPCWRGWCDYEFMIRDVPAMITAVTGVAYPAATRLLAQECPTPETCQCVHHDDESAVRAQLGEQQ